MSYGFTPDTETLRPDTPIVNAPWFVDVNLREFSENWQIPLSFTDAYLINLLLPAMDDVNQTLQDWVNSQASAGYTNIAAVPAKSLNGISAKVTQYKRAIYSMAKSELIKNNISVSRKDEAESNARTSDNLSDHYAKMSSKAIAKVMDELTIGVELI